jgi:tRNA A-37 threonylcarbamoyl transferase component Bud32/2-polyprenyl-3-methyl-5-hydroxy-6-metoxy-1,4-benzoquinol methylase
MNLLNKLSKIPTVVSQNGLRQSIYLVYICALLPFVMKILPIYLRLYLKIYYLKERYNITKEFRRFSSRKNELLNSGKRSHRTRIDDFGFTFEKLKKLKEKQSSLTEEVIAEIDQDGYLKSNFGLIENLPVVSEDQFMPRKGFKLSIVAVNGDVGVKKRYGLNKIAFIRELKALNSLTQAGCNVPELIDIDFENLTLTFSYISGSVLREELYKSGAFLRDRDENIPMYNKLRFKEKWLKRIEEGKKVLYDVVSKEFVDELFYQLTKIHAAGFILGDIKYGNVIIEKKTGKPYFIDFDHCSNFSEAHPNCFLLLRDLDINKFNLHFNTDRLTYQKTKALLATEFGSPKSWYAPVYFGAGLRVGPPIWDIDSGYGRWHYVLKQNLPDLRGKRILDLGVNNGFNSIQMVRYGAREVIGIEIERKNIDQGYFIKEAFELIDNTHYNFSYHHADMKDIITMGLGKFDLVTAFCSIYYLADQDLFDVINFISTITNKIILQCNIDKCLGRDNSHTYTKASVEYTIRALQKNGFPNINVISPPNYHRPLVIGTNTVV